MYQDLLVVWLFLHQDNNHLYLRRPKQQCQNSHGVFKNRDWILPLTQRNLKLQPLGLPGRPQTTNLDLVGFQGHQPANIPHHWQVRATCALASRASTQICKIWHLNLMGDQFSLHISIFCPTLSRCRHCLSCCNSNFQVPSDKTMMHSFLSHCHAPFRSCLLQPPDGIKCWPHGLVHQHGKCKNCGTALKKPQGMKRALQNMKHLQSKQAHRNRMKHLEKLLTSCIKNS